MQSWCEDVATLPSSAQIRFNSLHPPPWVSFMIHGNTVCVCVCVCILSSFIYVSCSGWCVYWGTGWWCNQVCCTVICQQQKRKDMVDMFRSNHFLWFFSRLKTKQKSETKINHNTIHATCAVNFLLILAIPNYLLITASPILVILNFSDKLQD